MNQGNQGALKPPDMLKKEGKMGKRLILAWSLLAFFLISTIAYATTVGQVGSLKSTDHTVNLASNDNVVTVTWTAASVTDSSLNGYATAWDHSSTTDPVTKTLSASATTTNSPTLSDASDWYFHIRAIANDGTYGTTSHLGPFVIDTKPTITSISPKTGSTSSTTNITITGTNFVDGATVKIGTTSATNVNVASSVSISATAPSGMSASTYDIKVTNPDSQVATLANAFTVSSANTKPVANAGPDQTKMVNNTVTLDGSGSTDADGDTLTYSWSQTSGDSVTLSAKTTANPTFTPTSSGIYTFSLKVSDGTDWSDPDTVSITVNSSTNSYPVAKITATASGAAVSSGQIINPTGTEITFSAAGSTDPDGNDLTYSWTLTSKPTGSTAALSNLTATSPTLTPDKPGDYLVKLVVNDGTVDSLPVTFGITANTPPTANAGSDQSIHVGLQVQLDGSGSSSRDSEQSLSYAWAFSSKPSGSTATLSNEAIANPTFNPDLVGTYILTLTVNDGIQNAADNVTITSTNTKPVANAGPDQTATVNSPVTLDGSNSADADSDTLTYSWSQTSGDSVTLSSTTVVSPTFTPTSSGTYVFSLTVNDGTVSSDPDTVSITVSSAVSEGGGTTTPESGEGGGLSSGETVVSGTTVTISSDSTVSSVTNEGTIENSGTVQDSTNKGTIEGGNVAGTIENAGGTLKDVTIAKDAVVKGGNVEGTVTVGNGAKLDNVTVAADATINVSGTDVEVTVVTESGSKMVLQPGSTMHGVVSSPEGASLNIPEGAIVTITGTSVTIQFSRPEIPGSGFSSFAALSIPALPEGYTLVDALTVCPDGYRLSQPATLVIPYDAVKIPADLTKADLMVFALDPDPDPDTVQWVEVAVKEATDSNVTIDTDMLSTYAVVAQSIIYPVITTVVGTVVDPELIEAALEDILPGISISTEPNKALGLLDVNIAGISYPVVATGTGTAQVPEKARLEVLNGGLSAQFVLTDGTTIQIAPMAADPEGLNATFANAGLTTEFMPDKGMVLVKDTSNNSYAGIFGWAAGTVGTKTIDTFTSTDGCVQIVYKDGSTQSLAPAAGSLQGLLDLFKDVNVQFAIDRSTGVINLANGSSCWKPDYTVRPFFGIPLPIAGTEWGEYIENRDAHGIYFKGVGDVNGDGLDDVEMWTGLGKQVIWQVPCR